MATRHLYEIILDPNRPKRVYASGGDLVRAAHEYFQFVTGNPIETHKYAFHNGEPVRALIPKVRLARLNSLLAWLGVGLGVWNHWKLNHPELADAISAIETAIDDYVLVNAGAGTVSEQISIRLLGLKDAKEIDMRADVKAITLKDISINDVSETDIVEELARRGVGLAFSPAVKAELLRLGLTPEKVDELEGDALLDKFVDSQSGGAQ